MAIEVCAPGGKRHAAGLIHFRDGGAKCCFNYTEHLEQLIRAWCGQYPELSHIDMDRVILSVARCRLTNGRGAYASVASLRFGRGRGGGAAKPEGQRRQWPRVVKNGCEALYMMKFYLPRFHNLPYEAKVTTILHELYHIDPKFNGEFRNLGGRRWAHGPSRRSFERLFAPLQREIIKAGDPVCEFFLSCDFSALVKRVGHIYGRRHPWVAAHARMSVLA